MPPPVIPDPVLPPKPWYLSKAVIGGIIAALSPLIARAFPALGVVDPNTVTDLIIQAIDLLGPLVGGGLAIVGRLAASRPIAGTAKARQVEQAEEAERYAASVHEAWDRSEEPIQRAADDLEDLVNRAQRFVDIAQRLAPIVAPLVAAHQALGEAAAKPDPDMSYKYE